MMRLVGQISGEQAVVLVDTGSTYSFLDLFVVQWAKLKVDKSIRLTIRVANGAIVPNEG